LSIQRYAELAAILELFSPALADASEMAEVFRQEDIEVDTDHALPLTIGKGAISFNKLCFTIMKQMPVRHVCLRISP